MLPLVITKHKNDVLSPQHLRLADLTFADKSHDISLILNSVKNDDVEYMHTLERLVDDILLWPLIMACSIVCKHPEASFKQEYIIPQMIYQFYNHTNGFSGIRYYSTKLGGIDRGKIRNAMINFALPAQDVKRSGFCPRLAGHLALTEPINIRKCDYVQIDAKYGWTPNGIPIVSRLNSDLQQNETVVALDKTSSYFDHLVTKFIKQHDLNLLQPLYGWKEERVGK